MLSRPPAPNTIAAILAPNPWWHAEVMLWWPHRRIATFFMRMKHPRAQLYVRRTCNSIETTEHCFFTCLILTQIWQMLWNPCKTAFEPNLD
ncbi:hypothetical protein PHMEG_0009660 [Phytophthora megakarya]|uniref:Uncharacterized protein n=1 Tax=Phytophthora megakarya TaxID=4795 RepID=A0A225WH17_9STRA|nr:hypothetical protein PHMEG_0009660 [Phytophthora megakarya]